MFRTYCLIGGMPEIVAHYAEHKDLAALTPIYESLLVSYLDHVRKYAHGGSQIDYIRYAIRSRLCRSGKADQIPKFWQLIL